MDCSEQNAGFHEKFKAYDLEKGKFYGVNLFDFADSQLADKIIQSN